MKKSILVLLCIMAVGVTAAGCSAGTASTVNPTSAPATMRPVETMEPTMSPQMSPQISESPQAAQSPMSSPDTEGSASPAAMTPSDAGRLAERISEAVERLSEVDDAEVIVKDERVLVAVEFGDQYSAGLDDRMKQMITETVQEIDETLTDVQITDDNTVYGQVKSLAERLANATGFDELADDFGDLWDRITGM